MEKVKQVTRRTKTVISSPRSWLRIHQSLSEGERRIMMKATKTIAMLLAVGMFVALGAGPGGDKEVYRRRYRHWRHL